MHHRNRRARRAVATLSIALAAAGVAAVAVPGVASANDPQPEVRARIIDGRLLVRGGDAGEVLALRSPAALPTTIDVDLGNDGVADVTFQRSLISSVDVRAGGGDDTVLIDETAGVGVPFTDTIPTTINGQDGDDLLLGGSGAENFHGGRDNDVVDGNRGNDTATLDAGDDEFIWDPGDGSDTIEGKSGSDLMTFNGAGGNENFAFVDNGGRLRFTRNVGNIVMDTNKVERVTVNALGGTDLVEIDDLARTDVTTIDIDEGLTLGAAGGDGVVDSVFVDGTEYDDDVAISGSAGSVSITGLAATVNITDAETIDRLLFAALGGDDRIDASLLGADTMHLDLLGGDGDDTLLGGDGAENFLAGAGNDFVDGNRGNDTADLEADDDEFLWDPGDGSDIVEGRDGYDVMTFNGSGGDEIFATTAIGDRMAFTRNLGNIFMDTNDVEAIDLRALGGADQLTAGDATGTELVALYADLAPTIGGAGGDGLIDSITVLGTPGDDTISVTGANGAVQVAGLASTLDVTNADPTDRLTVTGNGGTDTIDSAGLAAGTIELTIN
jgi:Ca2+-binding RTX toxin-like protein